MITNIGRDKETETKGVFTQLVSLSPLDSVLAC